MSGGPFGQTQYSPAAYGSAPEYKSLDQFKGFDSTPQFQALQRQLLEGGAQQQNSAIANASKLGAGRSAGTLNNLNTIQAQTENRIGDVNAGLGEKSFEDRMGQQNAANQFGLGVFNAQNSAANAQNQNNLAEQAQRQKGLFDSIPYLATLLEL